METEPLPASPRRLIHLPGYVFAGHGQQHFGFGGAQPVDLYRKRGGITADVRTLARNQITAHGDAVERWTMMHWRDHGDSVVAIRVSA